MPNEQTTKEGARNFVPEKRPVRVAVCALRRQVAGKIKKRLIVARQPLNQLRVERRTFCGRKRELAGIDRNDNGYHSSAGVGAVVGSRRTNGQRPGLRFVRKCPIGDAAFKMRALRDLEEDVVPSRLRAEMHAALEPRVEDKYAAFTRRTPGAQRCWKAAILLREAKFRGFVEHRSTPRLTAKPRLCLPPARWGWSLRPARSMLYRRRRPRARANIEGQASTCRP